MAASVGSLRRGSCTRRLTEVLARLAGDFMRIGMLDRAPRVNNACRAFDADGELVNMSTRERYGKFVGSFETWIRQITGK